MKKFLRTVVLTTVITMIWLVLGTILANAERKAIIQNGTLIVKEITETELLRVPSVPAGLSVEQADSLVTGQLGKVIIMDEIGEKNSSFSFPLIKSRIAYTDKKVSYLGGWIVQREPDRSTTSYDDYLLSIFWLWIPSIFTVIASIMILLSRTRKLRVFYIALLAVVPVSTVTGMFVGVEVSAFIGLIVCYFAVGFSIRSSLNSLMGIMSSILGGIAGGLACLIASIFAGDGNYKIVAYYLLFLIAVEIVSFVISQITKVMPLAYIEWRQKRTEEWIHSHEK